MFTGIIEKIGTISALERVGEGARLSIEFEPWDTGLELGESIAVDGTCLTVTGYDKTRFGCDLLEETWSRTSLSNRSVGDRVNLERALRVGDRMGGHYVSGHVDDVGVIREISPVGEDVLMWVDASSAFLRGVVPKGSVAVNGISLTVAELRDHGFLVCLIPHTWAHTTLSAYQVGDALNLEADLIGKHVVRYLEASGR